MTFDNFSEVWIFSIALLVIVDSILKVIAMWKSARNDHLAWFVILALLNTAGILPIIYLLMHRSKPMDDLDYE